MKIKSSYTTDYKIKKVYLKNGTHYFRVYLRDIGWFWFTSWYTFEYKTVEDAVKFIDEKIAKDNASYKKIIKTEAVDF